MASVGRLVGDAAARLLFTPATVGTVLEHERFRTIELVGDKLTGTGLVPGDKLRIHLNGLTLRTYTPLSWDHAIGSTRLLAYLGGHGPGSEWCAQVQPGDACQFLGPQRSVRLDRLASPPILTGDETSFGLLLAWQHLRPGAAPAAAVFEVTDRAVAATVLAAHGAASDGLVERKVDDAHFEELERRVVKAVRAAPDAPLVLTGRAQTIAALRRRLKAEGLTRPNGAVKAYWDQNRRGLD